MKHVNRQGFTLVELIVVIAIIAVLSAVSVVGFTGFIDQARFSNDTQTAASMSRTLDLALVNTSGIDAASLEAHDVRTLLDENSDTPFDFTPRASETGFFYLAEQQSIIAAKFDDIAGLDIQALSGQRTELLAGDTLPVDIESPEALFGNDRLLLSTGGSTVADIVNGIRSGYSHVLLENYNNPGFLEGLLRNTKFQDLLDQLLDAYDPRTTLYVSNVAWKTEAVITNPAHVIERIVFTAGIRNVPTFDDYLEGTVNYAGDIVLPRTVRSIEKYAFIQFENTVDISVRGATDIPLVMHNQALRAGVTVTGAELSILDQTAWEARLEAFPEDVITIEIVGSSITYNFEGLPDRDSVVGYSVSVNGSVHTISVYSTAGLIGIVEIDIDETP
jgi:prepilin-type N-terminal cleavage/methylation domain-containing protein